MSELAFANTWSKSEDQALLDGYGKVDAKVIAKRLGRSTSAVFHRAARIGAVARRRWTADDDQELCSLWGEMSLGRLAKTLKRTALTTYWRAQQLGLPLGCPRGREYLSAAAKRTGYTTGQLRKILRAHGVTLSLAMARPMGKRARHHFVDPQDVDEAVAKHLEASPVLHAARVHGVDSEVLKEWLLRAKAAGLAVPDPPTMHKATWRVHDSVVAEVLAWRATLETVRAGAKRVGINRTTLRKRLLKAGLTPPPVKPWWVAKADVDRAAGGAR